MEARIRYEALLRDSGLAEVEALVASLSADDPLLGDALLLVARRADEAGDHGRAVAAATRARALARTEAERAVATRAVGAALIRAGSVAEGLAELDPVMDRPGPLFGGSGAFYGRPIASPVRSARDEAATVASWAQRTTPEWVRAIGVLGERSRDAALVERCREALAGYLELDPDQACEELAVVLRQALERRAWRTAALAAEALGDCDTADAQALLDQYAELEVPEDTDEIERDELEELLDSAESAEARQDLADAAEAAALLPTDVDDPELALRILRLRAVLDPDPARGRDALYRAVVERPAAELTEGAGADLADSAGWVLGDAGDPRVIEVLRRRYDGEAEVGGAGAYGAVEALRAVGTAHASLGQVTEARDVLSRALAGFVALGFDPVVAAVQEELDALPK